MYNKEEFKNENCSCYFILWTLYNLWTLYKLIDGHRKKRMGYDELIRFYLTYSAYALKRRRYPLYRRFL